MLYLLRREAPKVKRRSTKVPPKVKHISLASSPNGHVGFSLATASIDTILWPLKHPLKLQTLKNLPNFDKTKKIKQ